jgi:hypothetical protein
VAGETEEFSDQEWADFCENNPASVSGVDFCFKGMPDKEMCQRIGDAATALVTFCSRLNPLQDLDGVTYAADYADALATLDRGMEFSTTLTASEDTFAKGIAMAPAVKRDGKLKTHVVIAGEYGLGLLSEDAMERELAVHTLVHELGHVAEHTLMEQALPGVMLSRIEDKYEAVLFANAHSAWSEYFAERTAATFGPSFQGHFQEALEGAINQQVDEIAKARAALSRSDSSTATAVGNTTILQVGKTMKMTGYLFGHADGRDVDPFLGRESLRDLIEQHNLMPWLDGVRERLRILFDSRNSWKSLDEHFVLNRALEEGSLRYGVTLHRSPNFAVGWHVSFS